MRLVVLALTAVAAPAFAQAPKWTTFAPKADGFSVLMPATPRMTPQSMGGVTTHIYIAQTGTVVAVASKSTLPANFGKANVDAMTKAMRESMMRTSGSTAGTTRAATHGGLAGEQTDFKTSSGGSGTTWIAHTPKALYSLTIAGRKPVSAAETKRFLDSFRGK